MKKSILLILVPLFLFSENYSLSPMEQKSIEMAKKWINNNSKIERQKDGSLAFYYGDNMPSLICKPLSATVIKLGKDEVLKDIKSGDADRWKFDTVKDAADGRTFVLVKPTKANIMTNLIIFTDKRIYNIKLVSTATTWTPSISFIYNNSVDANTKDDSKSSFLTPQKTSSETKAQIPKPAPKTTKKTTTKKGEKKKKSKYVIKSNGLWKPKHVYTKKGSTYIDIGDEDKSSFRLYVINSNKNKTIRYRYKNNKLIIKSIIKKAILVKDGFTKTVINIRRRK